MAKMILNTAAGISAAIASLARRGTALKNDAQKVAIACMIHMESSGDYTSTAIPLFEAIQKAFGNNLAVAMQEYFLANTWLVYDEESKTFKKDRSKSMNIEQAKESNWYDTERPAKSVPFDAQRAVETLLKRAAKANETGHLIEAMEKALASAKADAAKEQAETEKTVERVSGK